MKLWGIDLGGTKTEGVVLESRENPRVLARLRQPTEAQLGYDHIVEQIARLVDRLAEAVGERPAAVGIGHPGTLDPTTGAIKNANTTALNGRPFDRDLATRLGVPVRLANDANCFAVAETLMGVVPDVLPDAQAVFGVIMGTGVGGGLVVHGRVINGRQGLGGEWGHNFLDAAGGPCYCGKTGCVEMVLCGPALERYYAGLTGTRRAMPEIVQRATERDLDAAAVQTLDHLIENFGRAIAVIINIVDPDVIVLGGGLGQIDRLYTDGVAAAVNHIFDTRTERRLATIFARPKLGDSAGVFGAALLY
jgi:fructokinase